MTSTTASKTCVHNVAPPAAISLPIEHREVIDVLLDRPTTSDCYEAEPPTEPVSVYIDKSDLDVLQLLYEQSKPKTAAAPTGERLPKTRDTEWINVFEKYVDPMLDTCVFMYRGHHFSTAKVLLSASSTQFLISADAQCNFSTCTCTFHATIFNDGRLEAKFKGRIRHDPSEQRSRPYRGSRRRAVAEQLTSGQSPDQLRLKQLGLLTEKERQFGKVNKVGASPHVFRKIRSEAKTSLMLDKDLSTSLQKIKSEQGEQINADKSISGYLQTITIEPLRLTLYTEGGLVLWKKVGGVVPVSWDATGGIVMNRGKRVFYYELTMSNIAPQSVTAKHSSGPSFPITAMLSTTHTTMDLVAWLQDFESAFRKLNGFKTEFPKPPIVHSDGAVVFQMAALRFFNGDASLSVYLKRCWSIVNKKATDDDLKTTIIHSCLAHFVKSVKRQATANYAKKKVDGNDLAFANRTQSHLRA